MDDFIKNKARQVIFGLKEYLPGKPIEEVKRELGREDIIKIASNENPLGASPKAVAAVKAALDRLHYYPDGSCYLLKEKLAVKFGFDASAFLIGNGSDELLRLIAETFLNEGDEVIIAEPTFSEYEFSAAVMGAQCIKVPLKDYRHDLEAMLGKVSTKTKILYLCNPNNPTGTILSRNVIENFMDRIPQDILIIFDEAYSEYADPEEFLSGLEYLRQGRNVIVLKTFSKIYGLAALRIGYGLTKPEIAGAIKKVSEPFNVNMLAQVAAEAALEDDLHLLKSLEINNRGREYLYTALKEMGLEYVPTQSNFLLIDTKRDCRDVFAAMLQEGIIVRPGHPFGYKTHIRITIGTDAENQRFIKALQTILQGL